MTTLRAAPSTRRRLAGLLATLALVLALGPGAASGATAVVLTTVVSGLNAPVYVTSANDGTDRLFVVEQTGRIRVVKNGVLLPTPFLDISDRISTGGERGLLGLAFSPSFKTSGRFYVNYTKTNGNTFVADFTVSPPTADVAIKASARGIIEVAQPYANHNGGMLAFAGGYLYIGMGDGGGAGDPGNRAQNLDSLLGKILRIDIGGNVGTRHYRIPASNPYVGKAGRDEIWSLGLRNPWRFSFDRLTGDLWIGDVGQAKYEELDRAKVSTASTSRGRGVNFGWPQMEGAHCFKPATGCNRTGRTLPAIEYTHADGCSVTGGYVYRGAANPSLAGKYVFGDFCSGKIWTYPAGASWPTTRTLLMDTNLSISSFGEDRNGELYVVDRGGAIYRFTTP